MESTTEAINFGKSKIVPSVQELSKEYPTKIPHRYARPDQDPPFISTDKESLFPSVPIIDLERLVVELEDTTNPELDKLHSACLNWGFFQVVNHGVSRTLLEAIKSEVKELFELPYEEKKKLWQQPDNHEGFGQLFVVSEEQKLDWSDMFYITTLPVNLRQNDLFEKLPLKLRTTMDAYSSELKRLAVSILGHMAKALKMDADEMKDLFGDGVQSIRMNYYPPCPEPEKAIGFTPHSDADALTILFQLNETEGLQIRKDGRWVPVKPVPGALVVNVGDIIEIVSNGLYRSIEHRATVNSASVRLSVATFYSCKLDCTLGPAFSIITPHNPAVFRQIPVEKYFKMFFSRKLNGKAYRDFMRLGDGENNSEGAAQKKKL